MAHSAFLRYALTGCLATALHYSLLLTLVELLQWPPGLAAAMGACAGALLAYFGNRRFTFAGGHVRHRAALPRFAVVALAGALLNGLIVGGLSRLGLHYLLAQLLATLTVLLLGFRLNKTWTFA